jgi:hypothetical protein
MKSRTTPGMELFRWSEFTAHIVLRRYQTPSHPNARTLLVYRCASHYEIIIPSSSSADYCRRSNRSSLLTCRRETGFHRSHLTRRSWGFFRNLSQGYVSVRSISFLHKNTRETASNCYNQNRIRTNLQCIFSREALLTVPTRERLHCQMDSLMTLQIVIAIKGLGTLVAFEGSIILLLLLPWMVSIHLSAHLMLWILHLHIPSN